MLAGTWRGQSVAGWWLSEKFDGVRAFWDGAALRTRSWRAIAAPEWFTAALPRGVALDGELWGGRGTFQLASELARFSRTADAAWRTMRFMVFDAPTTAAIPFETRMASVQTLTHGRFARSVAQTRCRDSADALATMRAITAAGGEGVMLRRPGHCYAFERSSDWLKLKPSPEPSREVCARVQNSRVSFWPRLLPHCCQNDCFPCISVHDLASK